MKYRGLVIYLLLVATVVAVIISGNNTPLLNDEEYRPQVELNAGDQIIAKVSEDYAVNLTNDQVLFVSQGINRYKGIGVYDTARDEVVKYVDSMESIEPQLDENSHQITQVTIDSVVYKITENGLRLVSPGAEKIYYSEQGDLYRKNDILFYNGVEIAEFGEGKGQIQDFSMIRQAGDYIFYQSNSTNKDEVLEPQKVSAYNIETGEVTKTKYDFNKIHYLDGKYYVTGDFPDIKVVDTTGNVEELRGTTLDGNSCSIYDQTVIKNQLYSVQSCRMDINGKSDFLNKFFMLNENGATWEEIEFDNPPLVGDKPYIVEEGVLMRKSSDEKEIWKYFAFDTLEERSGTSYNTKLGTKYSEDTNAVVINKNGNEISTFTTIYL